MRTKAIIIHILPSVLVAITGIFDLLLMFMILPLLPFVPLIGRWLLRIPRLRPQIMIDVTRTDRTIRDIPTRIISQSIPEKKSEKQESELTPKDILNDHPYL